MASLNLQPNLQLMLAQAAVFAANFYVVKKLFVSPYLKIKEKRDLFTTGRIKSSEISIKECRDLEFQIEERLKNSREEVVVFCEKEKQEAIKQKNVVLTKAKEEAEKVLQKMRLEIQEKVKQENEKIASLAKPLADEVFQKVIH